MVDWSVYLSIMVPSLTGKYSGAWTQDEYQNLFDLVNLDLRVKAHQKIAPSHRQVCDSLSLSIICF